MAIPNDPGVDLGRAVSENIVDEGNALARRKRSRTEDGTSKSVVKEGALAGEGGVNRTITLLGGNRVIMTPTSSHRSSKEIGVSIRPSERWIGGATIPMRALQIFNLPQDASAYAGRSRVELVDRCLGRAGRVYSIYIIYIHIYLFF